MNERGERREPVFTIEHAKAADFIAEVARLETLGTLDEAKATLATIARHLGIAEDDPMRLVRFLLVEGIISRHEPYVVDVGEHGARRAIVRAESYAHGSAPELLSDLDAGDAARRSA